MSACPASPPLCQFRLCQGQAHGKALALKQTLLEMAVKKDGVAWVTKTTSHLQVTKGPGVGD